MELQLSSGSGPAECERAVAGVLNALKDEFPGIEVIVSTPGRRDGDFRSVRISSESDLSFLEGTILWICKSPYRPHHGRKNWFVDVSVCRDAVTVDFDESSVRFETFRSGGHGGQNVNKVETGVRAVHESTGISAISTDERSQHLNRQIALKRLREAVTALNSDLVSRARAGDRLEHTRIERGNPVRVYEGLEFRRVLRGQEARTP
jgi:peptide chain release factor